MSQLKLTRPTDHLFAHWGNPRGGDSYLCGVLTDKYVIIPSYVRTIYMVFHEKRVPDSFKFKVKYPNYHDATLPGQSMVIAGTDSASLYFHLEQRLGREVNEGRSYFTIEYDE